MPSNIDITRLKTSWTKYGAVQVIEIVANNNLDAFVSGEETIDQPILKAFLGVKNLEEPYPFYWNEIQKHPKQLRLFALIAALFTHHTIIKKFAESYSKKGAMTGVYKVEDSKVGTNIRSALVVSGAALENYRKEETVPYNLSALFENGEVGLLIRQLLTERLIKIGYDSQELINDTRFVDACQKSDFISALALTKVQFEKWIKGKGLNLDEELFQFNQLKIYQEIPMLKVHQWMNEWDDIDFKSPLRQKPEPFFYIFNIDARLLKKLSDVHRRKPEGDRVTEISVQRGQNDQRVDEIRKYIEGGFPWSTISRQEQKLPENEMLKMPGLLPTAIIANILGPNEVRNGKKIANKDRITIDNEDSFMPKLVIPTHVFDDKSWEPPLKPIEIIDGQHRLWAFDENQNLSGNYEFPVIAFYNLDRAWQAYLFYTINIKPVKINTSLGFDLYPLLRTQNWLENSKDGLLAYRETRAQEIVEALWLYDNSPWKNRVNMLGEAGGPTMSQAAFVRALVNSFFKRKAGFYSDKLNDQFKIINWNRSQQTAFIILLWQKISTAVSESQEPWAEALRNEKGQTQLFDSSQPDSTYRIQDAAFLSKNSFLSRDQGVRGLMLFANDFFYIAATYNDIDFNTFVWEDDLDERSILPNSIEKAIALFSKNRKFINLLNEFAACTAKVDWRTSSADFADDSERDLQMKYKGSSGYAEFRKELIKASLESNDTLVKKFANQVASL